MSKYINTQKVVAVLKRAYEKANSEDQKILDGVISHYENADFGVEIEDDTPVQRYYGTPFERQRAAVYATGNKWAIENWNATHN